MHQKKAFGGKELYTIVLLCLINFFLFADQNLMAPNLTQIARDFGMSDLERDTLLGGQIALGFWLLGGIVTLFIGYITDKLSRKKLFLAVVLIGEIPCFITAFAQNYPQLFVLRALTGIGLGGVIPLTYSLLGDLFSANNRAKAVALISVASGLGLGIGQMIAGFTTDMCLGTLCGWRIPFIVVAAPGFLMALLFWFTTKETPRGNTEESLKELIESGKAYTAKINWSEYKLLFKNKTNILIILQSLPGIVPWSVLLVYLNDFLAQEKGYTVQAATTLVMLLGVGILSGNIVGGFIGDIIYRKSKKWLPIACGMMVLVGVILTLMIVLYPSQANVQNPEYIPLIVLSVLTGIIIAPAGTMLWAMLINVNLPEVRGSASSLFNMVDTLGKGFGPFFVSQIIVALGRQQAFVISILFWVPSALIFFLLAFTLPKDVEALETVLKERAKNLT